MLIKILKPDFKFKDDRGVLTQLVHSGFQQINIIESKEGVIRGGHYHKNNDEAFYVITGSIELKLKKDEVEESYVFNNGDMFLIPACVVHDFLFLMDTKLVGMYTNGVENVDGTKDILKG